MDSSLTREEKRKNKKKERKRKQRQAVAIARNELQQGKNSDNEEINAEEEEETNETEAKRQKVDQPSENSSKTVVCFKCSSDDISYFCEDCGKEYCANVGYISFPVINSAMMNFTGSYKSQKWSFIRM